MPLVHFVSFEGGIKIIFVPIEHFPTLANCPWDIFTAKDANMLYLIGLGLADEKDISVKGLEIVKRAERVYLEAYTAILLVEKEHLVCDLRASTSHFYFSKTKSSSSANHCMCWREK